MMTQMENLRMCFFNLASHLKLTKQIHETRAHLLSWETTGEVNFSHMDDLASTDVSLKEEEVLF